MRQARNLATDDSAEVLLSEGAKALAKKRGVSLRTLRRRFRSRGITLSGFVQTRRAALTVNLLQQPGALVRDTAKKLGFSSDVAFIRFVKREFGKTPGDLRDELSPSGKRDEEPGDA
jgi:AraC-like DNA-binding protein